MDWRVAGAGSNGGALSVSMNKESDEVGDVPLIDTSLLSRALASLKTNLAIQPSPDATNDEAPATVEEWERRTEDEGKSGTDEEAQCQPKSKFQKNLHSKIAHAFLFQKDINILDLQGR